MPMIDWKQYAYLKFKTSIDVIIVSIAIFTKRLVTKIFKYVTSAHFLIYLKLLTKWIGGKFLYMLKEKNVDRGLIKVTDSSLDNRSQTVRTDDEKIERWPILNGALQGTVPDHMFQLLHGGMVNRDRIAKKCADDLILISKVTDDTDQPPEL